jgi:sugar lactone lactonase YvrE
MDFTDFIDGRAEVVAPARRSLGEGAVWCPIRKKLLWCDITRGKIFSYDPKDGSNASVDLRQSVGTVVPLDENRVVAAVAKGVVVVDLTKADGAVFGRVLGNPCDLLTTRYNDGKCDPRGRLWVGTMGCFCEDKLGSLYSFEVGAGAGAGAGAGGGGGAAGGGVDGDAPVRVRKHLSDVTVSNGIAWTADAATMYYIDTATLAVDAFDFDAETGDISNRRQVRSVLLGTVVFFGLSLDSYGATWQRGWCARSVGRC